MNTLKVLNIFTILMFLFSLNINSVERKSTRKITKYEGVDNSGSTIELTRDLESGKFKCSKCKKEMQHLSTTWKHLRNVHKIENYKITFQNGKIKYRQIGSLPNNKPKEKKLRPKISKYEAFNNSGTKIELTRDVKSGNFQCNKCNKELEHANSAVPHLRDVHKIENYKVTYTDGKVQDKQIGSKGRTFSTILTSLNNRTKRKRIEENENQIKKLSKTNNFSSIDSTIQKDTISDDGDGDDDRDSKYPTIPSFTSTSSSLSSLPSSSSFTSSSSSSSDSSLRSLLLLTTTRNLQNIPSSDVTSIPLSSSINTVDAVDDVDAQPKDNIVDAVPLSTPSSTSSRSSNSSSFSIDDKEGKEEQETIDAVSDSVIIQNQTPFKVQFTSAKNKSGILESFMNIALKRDNFTFTLLNGNNEPLNVNPLLNINPLDKDSILLKLSHSLFDYQLLKY